MALQQKNLSKFRRRLTNAEINAMPIFHYEGPVHLIRSEHDWFKALPDLETTGILGFDTETKPTFRKGRVNRPALVQLATDHAVYLVQLTWWPFDRSLAELLGNPGITKAGVGILLDMQALAKLFPFVPRGLVDIGTVARLNKFAAQGLRSLSALLFGWRISKGSQCSNWSLHELSEKQIVYAATDAWVGRLIYLKMQDLGLNLSRLTDKKASKPDIIDGA